MPGIPWARSMTLHLSSAGETLVANGQFLSFALSCVCGKAPVKSVTQLAELCLEIQGYTQLSLPRPPQSWEVTPLFHKTLLSAVLRIVRISLC